MKSILVTGASGFIGRNLVPRLVRDYQVFAHSKNQCSYPELENTIRIHGSFEEVTDDLVRSINTVIHLASSGVDQDRAYDLQELYLANVHEPYRLILRCLEAGVQQVVNLGSCFEYGYTAMTKGRLSVEYALMPQTQYAATKAALTTLLYPICNYFTSDIYNIRAYNIYGPHEKENRLYPSIQKAIEQRKVLHITHGSQVKHFSHVSTLVDRIIQIVSSEHNGSLFSLENHTDGKEMSVYTFARSLFEEAGLRPSEYIKRTRVSRANEPQFLAPDPNSSVMYFGEPLS